MSQNFAERKILIIDDDLAFTDFITSFLGQHGYAVIYADDGLNGLNIARAEMPDLVITSVMLPEIDGLHVCRLLKFDARYKKIPVMIISEEGTDIDESILQMINADAFFTKPVSPEDFLEKVIRITESELI